MFDQSRRLEYARTQIALERTYLLQSFEKHRHGQKILRAIDGKGKVDISIGEVM